MSQRSQNAGESRAQSQRDRQVVRILAILGALWEGVELSIHDLARRFGTRRETIYRDLRALEEAGYPITGAGGKLSHPRLMAGIRRGIPSLRLSEAELAAVIAAAEASASGTAFGDDLAAGLRKLRFSAVSNESFSSIEVWRRGWKKYVPDRETVSGMLRAILLRRRCVVTYKSPVASRTKTYEFDSYKLALADGGLYAIGSVPVHGNPIMLALDRVQSLQLTDYCFTDVKFDADAFRDAAFGVASEKPMKVVVRFRAAQAPYVREREWHPTQELRDLPGGGVEMSFHAGGRFEIVRWILGWGSAAEVVSPKELRTSVACAFRDGAAVYSTATSTLRDDRLAGRGCSQ